MSQLKRTLCFGIVVSILGLTTGARLGAARPRPEKANWDNVKQLYPGEEIRVVLNHAKSYRGLLQTVTDEGIVVRLATGEQGFVRRNILRVSIRTATNRGRNAAEGAAMGAAVGVPLVLTCSNDTTTGRTDWGFCVGAVAIFSGIGAGVEVLLHPKAWREVYRAR